MISLIVAMTQNRVIGCNNQLPWHLPADLRYFKQQTLGKPIIMGRKTFAAIGKLLPGRKNIIITRDLTYTYPGAIIAHSLQEALEQTKSAPEQMVIGGAEIFTQALPLCTKIHLTLIHADIKGDTYFPVLDDADWIETKHTNHAADAKNKYAYSFIVLERRLEST